MSTLQVLIQFKNGLITFLDELINQFPNEGDLVMLRIFLKDQVPIADVMNIFIHKLLPLKGMIQKKDEDFFLNHCNIFDEIRNNETKGKVSKFKTIWRSGTLDKEDKSVIWKWFQSFIFLTEKYQKSMLTDATTN